MKNTPPPPDYTFMKTGLMDSPGRDRDHGAFQDEIVTKILGVITVMLQKAVETAGIFAEHGGYHREITADDIRRAMKVQAQTFFKSEGDDLEKRVASVVQDIACRDERVAATTKVVKRRPIRRRGRGKRVVDADAEADGDADVDADTDGDVDADEDFHSSVPDLDLPYNACECKTCRDIRALVDGWDAWDPEDEVEKFLKKHIDQM